LEKGSVELVAGRGAVTRRGGLLREISEHFWAGR
jgi:hypothetical protein